MKLTSILRSKNWYAINRQLLRHMDANAALLLSVLCDEYEYHESRGNLTNDGYFFCTADKIEELLFFKRWVQDAAFKALVGLGILSTKTKGIPAKRHVKFSENADDIIYKMICENSALTTNKFVGNQQTVKQETYKQCSGKPANYILRTENKELNTYDNSKELSLLAKNENENFGNSQPTENPAVSIQSEKEKSCAKKEKATAITKEFSARGLHLFALAPDQPSNDWYFENKAKYGASTLWAVFERMHDWCERNTPYKAPARAFSKWAMNDSGLCAFNALQGYWEANTGSSYHASLAEVSIEHKLHLETIGTKVKQAMEQKGSMMPLQDAVRTFFDKMPDRWRGEWFDLAKIAKNMAVILAEIVNPTVRTNPYQKGGVVVTQELVDGTIDLVRQKREKKEADAQLMRDLGLTQ